MRRSRQKLVRRVLVYLAVLEHATSKPAAFYELSASHRLLFWKNFVEKVCVMHREGTLSTLLQASDVRTLKACPMCLASEGCPCTPECLLRAVAGYVAGKNGPERKVGFRMCVNVAGYGVMVERLSREQNAWRLCVDRKVIDVGRNIEGKSNKEALDEAECALVRCGFVVAS